MQAKTMTKVMNVINHQCLSVAGDPAVEAFGLGAVAFRFQQLGYSVLGLGRGSKRPHPDFTHGVSWATRDPAMVSWLWGRDPMAGIGIATGTASQLLVVDLDTKAGEDGPGNFARQFRGWPAPSWGYPLVATPSGGWHLWIRLPAGLVVPTRTGILPGVDCKAEGGYVAAPPSRVWVDGILRSDGSSGSALLPYRWVDGCPCSVPYAPEWLLQWIMSAPPAREQGEWHADGVPIDYEELAANGLPVGERNVTLHRLACSLFRRFGTTPAGTAAVRSAIGQVLDRTDRRGFGTAEAERTIASARTFIEGEEAADRAEWEQWMRRR